MKIRCIILSILWLFIFNVSQAQNFSVLFNHFTPHDGLGGMVNQVVFQDSRGYIWFASNEGIAYYNGYEFKQIEDHSGYSTEHIYFLDEDDKGRILILSETHLTIYDGKEFGSIPLPYKTRDGFIRKNTEGVKLFGLGFEIGNDIINVFELIGDSTFSLIPMIEIQNNRFERVDKDRLLVINENGLFVMGNDTVLFSRVDSNSGRHISSASHFPETGFSLRQFIQPPRDYFTYCRFSNELHTFKDINHFYESQKDNYIFHRNPPGKRGDYLYISENQAYIKIEEFSQEHIFRSFRDRSGQFWVTTNKGVFKYYLNGIFRLDTDPYTDIWGVSEWQGRLMFHSYLNGLIYWENDRWNLIPNTFSRGQLFPGRATSSESYHFIPAWDGVFVVDKNFETYYLETERFAEGLYFDKLSNELIAADEENLYFFDLGNLSERLRIPLPQEATRIGIFSIADLGGDLLLSGPGGVIRFNRKEKTFEPYTFLNGNLPCKTAINIFLDEWNQIWVTGNCGLMWWNQNEEVFELMEPFIDKIALVDMIEIGDGRYLITSNQAVFVVDIHRSDKVDGIPLSLRILKEYNQYNGFEGIKPYLTGFFRDSKSRIWIPTSTGTYMINPKLLKIELSETLMKLTSIDDIVLPFDQDLNSKFTLPFGSRNVNIGFDMICFDWPGKPGFQYRTSATSEWSIPQRDQIVRLQDLDHGLHQVEIRAIFTDRAEADWPVIKARLMVNLPIWERSWFPWFAAGFVLLSGLIIGGGWFYNRRIRLKQFQTYNQLQLLQIHALESQLNPHFIFNVLANIQKKVVMEQADQANDMIVKLGQLMRRYLESIESGINKSNEPHKSSLASELELIRLYMDFEKEKYQNKFQYTIDIDKSINPDTTVIFPMLLQPFVENCIKHGFSGMKSKGAINIRIFKKDSGLCIEVRDNGIGRAASLEKYKNQERAHRSKGNLLVNRRVELLQKLGHEVSLKIFDLKQGTMVRIYSPIFNS